MFQIHTDYIFLDIEMRSIEFSNEVGDKTSISVKRDELLNSRYKLDSVVLSVGKNNKVSSISLTKYEANQLYHMLEPLFSNNVLYSKVIGNGSISKIQLTKRQVSRLLTLGTVTVGKPNLKKIRSAKLGDIIRVNKRHNVKIARIRRYPSFEVMIDEEGYQKMMPNTISRECAVKAYKKYYTDTTENHYGVLAIDLSVIKRMVYSESKNE